MQKVNKKAFTLIEIIIATIILTAWIFGIYKLLSINVSNLNDYDNKAQINDLFINMQECIKSIWFSSFSAWTVSFNFWADNKWCFTGAYDSSLSFSWVNIDNKDYFLYWSASLASDKINWQLFIKESSLTLQEKDFTLYK